MISSRYDSTDRPALVWECRYTLGEWERVSRVLQKLIFAEYCSVDVGSTSPGRVLTEGHIQAVWPQENSDLVQSRGSCFSHRIPSARSSGKRALYIHRAVLSHMGPSLYVSQLDPQPSAVKRSQNKSAEISLYSRVGSERSAGRCFRRTRSHESKLRQTSDYKKGKVCIRRSFRHFMLSLKLQI